MLQLILMFCLRRTSLALCQWCQLVWQGPGVALCVKRCSCQVYNWRDTWSISTLCQSVNVTSVMQDLTIYKKFLVISLMFIIRIAFLVQSVTSQLSRARMWQYVRLHTRGMHCSLCKAKCLSLSALVVHEQLHKKDCPPYECIDCDKMYLTQTALHIHHTGKHGLGFLCKFCAQRFDTPAQKSKHEAKCSK